MLGFRSDHGGILGFMWIVMVILKFKWNNDSNFKGLNENYPNKIYQDFIIYLGLGKGILKFISKVMKWVIFFLIIYLGVSIWLGYINFETIG